MSFKAKVIHDCQPGVSQYDITEKYDINQSLGSKWLRNKNSNIENSACRHRKLLQKQRPSRKYNDLFQALLEKFREARNKGHHVNLKWLWSRARGIYREQQNNQSVVLKLHVIVTFTKKFHIRTIIERSLSQGRRQMACYNEGTSPENGFR